MCEVRVLRMTHEAGGVLARIAQRRRLERHVYSHQLSQPVILSPVTHIGEPTYTGEPYVGVRGQAESYNSLVSSRAR